MDWSQREGLSAHRGLNSLSWDHRQVFFFVLFGRRSPDGGAIQRHSAIGRTEGDDVRCRRFSFIIPSPLHFLHKEADRRVVCSLGSLFFLFSSFTAVLSIGQRHVARFSPSRSNSQNKMGKKGEAKSCLHFGQNSLVELTALLTRPHVYFLHNTSSNSLSFFKKNRFTLTLKSFRVFYPLLPEQFRTLKASDVLMMWSSRRMEYQADARPNE